MDRGAWWTTVLEVTKSWARLSTYECKQFGPLRLHNAFTFSLTLFLSHPSLEMREQDFDNEIA